MSTKHSIKQQTAFDIERVGGCVCLKVAFRLEEKQKGYLKNNYLSLDAGINSFFWVKAYLHTRCKNPVTEKYALKNGSPQGHIEDRGDVEESSCPTHTGFSVNICWRGYHRGQGTAWERATIRGTVGVCHRQLSVIIIYLVVCPLAFDISTWIPVHKHMALYTADTELDFQNDKKKDPF